MRRRGHRLPALILSALFPSRGSGGRARRRAPELSRRAVPLEPAEWRGWRCSSAAPAGPRAGAAQARRAGLRPRQTCMVDGWAPPGTADRAGGRAPPPTSSSRGGALATRRRGIWRALGAARRSAGQENVVNILCRLPAMSATCGVSSPTLPDFAASCSAHAARAGLPAHRGGRGMIPKASSSSLPLVLPLPAGAGALGDLLMAPTPLRRGAGRDAGRLCRGPGPFRGARVGCLKGVAGGRGAARGGCGRRRARAAAGAPGGRPLSAGRWGLFRRGVANPVLLSFLETTVKAMAEA